MFDGGTGGHFDTESIHILGRQEGWFEISYFMGLN